MYENMLNCSLYYVAIQWGINCCIHVPLYHYRVHEHMHVQLVHVHIAMETETKCIAEL